MFPRRTIRLTRRPEASFVDGNRQEFLGIRAVITEAEVELLARQMIDVTASVEDGCGRMIETTRQLEFLE